MRYPGTYKIPLVIGNCYQGGSIVSPVSQANNVEYGTGTIEVKDGGNVLSFDYKYGSNTFVNYNGDYVNSSNCIITNARTAEIFWHDFQHVETNEEINVIPEESLSIVTEGGLQFLKFKVDEDLIQQGNAVLAVRDAAGDIIWSWHIYITDRNWRHDVTMLTNYQGNEYFVSDYNLGYVEKCAKGNNTYPERYMKIRIHQPEGGLYREVTVKQNDFTSDVNRNHDWDTRYQWGRKDAMPGTVETYDYLGTYFPTSGYTKSGSSYRWGISAGASYADAIKNPDKRYAAGTGNYTGLWSNAIYANAWSAKNDKIATSGGSSNYISPVDNRVVTKTIYDPCPPGFCVPPSGVFTGFTKNGKNDGGTGNMNISNETNKLSSPSGTTKSGEAFKGNGYSFYSNGGSGASSGPTIFFPTTGRNKDGGSLADWRDNFGFVWSATPGIPGYAGSDTRDPLTGQVCCYHLSFNSSNVRPVIANIQTMPQSVRPMEDPAMHNHIDHEDSDIRPYDNQDDENLRLNN